MHGPKATRRHYHRLISADYPNPPSHRAYFPAFSLRALISFAFCTTAVTVFGANPPCTTLSRKWAKLRKNCRRIRCSLQLVGPLTVGVVSLRRPQTQYWQAWVGLDWIQYSEKYSYWLTICCHITPTLHLFKTVTFRLTCSSDTNNG